jgi:hypothetical protein
MCLNYNEEVAWLHVQDLQREAENRRLIAGERQSPPTSFVRRLFGRRAAAPKARASKRKREPA